MSEPPRLPPLATLVPFEAACRLQNFTRAAEELHFSQATVSRRIAELEAHLGITLFQRQRYDVIPTGDAEVLAASIRLALGEISRTTGLLRRRSDVSSMTVYSDLCLATSLVTPVLGDFQRSNPELKIRLLSSNEPIEATKEDFDIGVQYWRSGPSLYHVEAIADDSVYPVCSPGFADRLPAELSAADLAEFPLLHVAYDNTDWVDWPQFLAWFDTESPSRTDGMTFTSDQVCIDVAERGEGVALGWAESCSRASTPGCS
ncbi:LysR substrate-binding domain-containing protein [Candidatus Poriferisodalis sp.]|uniref:LysR substrate-binding domain-containing protein n=1 Tax=Candidatus Poriferisodalis sp. TaxID=3101277 RepID=UPI003B01AD14